jgi:hypothetical protein
MVENKASFSMRQGIAAVVFLALALGLATVTPSIEVAWVTGLLMLTIYLFAFEVVGVDVAALTIMVLLLPTWGWIRGWWTPRESSTVSPVTR